MRECSVSNVVHEIHNRSHNTLCEWQLVFCIPWKAAPNGVRVLEDSEQRRRLSVMYWVARPSSFRVVHRLHVQLGPQVSKQLSWLLRQNKVLQFPRVGFHSEPKNVCNFSKPFFSSGALQPKGSFEERFIGNQRRWIDRSVGASKST